MTSCLVDLDVMVTNQSGEVVEDFIYTGLDDATNGVGGEPLRMMLCVKKKKQVYICAALQEQLTPRRRTPVRKIVCRY